jgi:hypothetical protein
MNYPQIMIDMAKLIIFCSDDLVGVIPKAVQVQYEKYVAYALNTRKNSHYYALRSAKLGSFTVYSCVQYERYNKTKLHIVLSLEFMLEDGKEMTAVMLGLSAKFIDPVFFTKQFFYQYSMVSGKSKGWFIACELQQMNIIYQDEGCIRIQYDKGIAIGRYDDLFCVFHDFCINKDSVNL